MKKFFKSLVTSILAGSIALSAFGVAGCKKGNKNNIDENEDVEYITVFRNELDSFNQARKANTPLYQEVKKAIGVDIEAISASTDWSTMLSKMWFDQDLPDIFLCKGPESPDFYRKLIEGNTIIAIDDYVNESTKDEYPNLYEVMKRTSYLANNLSYAKGKQWAIPSAWELEKSMYVRQDWIDNLNKKLAKCLVGEGVIAKESDYTSDMYEEWHYDVPETLLDFYRLARAFTLYDPDGNGQNDTYGYESESNLDMDAWIYVAFGAGWHAEMKDKKTGKYIASEISDESLYATSFINRLLAEGYMSPNSISNDNGGKQTSFSRGKAGMIFAHNWLGTFVRDMIDSGLARSVTEANTKITMFDPPKGKDGKYGADGGYDNYWQFNCISADRSQKRIKICLKLFDFMYSDEGRFLFTYGVDGVNFKYVLDEAGNRVKDETFPDRDKKEPLKFDSKYGIASNIGASDSAYQLYSLGWWTGHYNCEFGELGKVVAERQQKSSKYSFYVDYPYIQTPKYMSSIETLRDASEEVFVEIMNDAKSKYWKGELIDYPQNFKYNAKTFGWDDLYTVPKTVSNRWTQFKKQFNNTLGGAAVYDEYNKYIESGKAMKRSDDGPIYKNCGSFYRSK